MGKKISCLANVLTISKTSSGFIDFKSSGLSRLERYFSWRQLSDGEAFSSAEKQIGTVDRSFIDKNEFFLEAISSEKPLSNRFVRVDGRKLFTACLLGKIEVQLPSVSMKVDGEGDFVSCASVILDSSSDDS